MASQPERVSSLTLYGTWPRIVQSPDYEFGVDPEEVGERTLQALRDQVKTTIGEGEVAAFIIEPVAGEGGFIPAPRSFLTGLRAYADEIGARWIDAENYHITLRFIGDVDHHIASDVTDMLDRLAQPGCRHQLVQRLLKHVLRVRRVPHGR